MRKLQSCKVECLKEGFCVAIGKLICEVSNDHSRCLRIERKGIVCAHILSVRKFVCNQSWDQIIQLEKDTVDRLKILILRRTRENFG